MSATEDLNELRASVASLQKDVESKAATIKHLQNALDAKSMTIGILSKTNKEGGKVEDHISAAVETKVKAKDEELAKLKQRTAELEKQLAGGGDASDAAAVRQACEAEKEKLRASLADERKALEQKLAGLQKEAQGARDGQQAAVEKAAAEAQKSLAAEVALREAAEEERRRLSEQLAEQKKGHAQALATMAAELEEQLAEQKKGHEQALATLVAEFEEQRLELQKLQEGGGAGADSAAKAAEEAQK